MHGNPEVIEWLGFNDRPTECKYSNLDKWLQDPSIMLLKKLKKKKALVGQRRKKPKVNIVAES